MVARTKARSVPIAELRDRELAHQRGRGSGKSWINSEEQLFRILEGELHVRWAPELENADLIRRLDGLLWARYRPLTARNMLATLKRIIRRGLKWGLVRSVPPFPDYVNRRGDELPRAIHWPALSRIDRDRLLGHMEGDESWEGRRIHALTATVALAHIGLTEALRLRVADIDRGIIRVRGGRGRRTGPDGPAVAVEIGPRLKAILAKWLPQTGCEWAFPGVLLRGPWRILSGNCRRREHAAPGPQEALEAAARAAGIEGVTFESLRRSRDEPARRTAATRPGSARSTKRALPEIRIGEFGDPVFIDGEPVPAPTEGQHKLVMALLAAGREGMSTMQFAPLHMGGWRESLAKLRGRHRLWGRIIVFPGRPYGRYRIDATRAPDCAPTEVHRS